MSRIDELIAEHCPDGVAFKALSELVRPVENVKWAEAVDVNLVGSVVGRVC